MKREIEGVTARRCQNKVNMANEADDFGGPDRALGLADPAPRGWVSPLLRYRGWSAARMVRGLYGEVQFPLSPVDEPVEPVASSEAWPVGAAWPPIFFKTLAVKKIHSVFHENAAHGKRIWRVRCL